jgi:DNA-binding helix-turn-helix protein
MNANLLRGKMAEKGISQDRLAVRIGISPQTLCRKISGKRDFKLAEIVKICEVLNIENPIDIFLR